MAQNPNFHISVPSGWAKLGNVFHVHICPTHYLTHSRLLKSAAFMWLSPILIVLLFYIFYIFLFFSDFQFISKINISSIVVLMKCNCNNTRGCPLWLHRSFSWKKDQIVIDLGKISCHFTTKKNIWTPSVHSILRLGRPNLVINCTIVYCINHYLHIVDTITVWVAMSWWIIRSYPYPQNSVIPEVVIFSIHYNTNNALALSNGTHVGTIFVHLKSDFTTIYVSYSIYPYDVNSPVPHRWFRVHINGHILMGQFLNHLAHFFSLFISFTTMLAQYIAPLLPYLLFISYVF